MREKQLHKMIVVFLLFTILILLPSCNNEFIDNQEQYDVKLYLRTAKFYEEEYLFELKSGILTVWRGKSMDPFPSKLKQFTFDNISECESVVLPSEEYNTIIAAVDSLESFRTSEYLSDAWMVTLLINSEYIERSFVYGMAGEKSYDDLVSLLIKYSPIKIINSDGYTIKRIDLE